MKIIRCQDSTGQIVYASLRNDGRAFQICGELYGDFIVTSKEVNIAKLLAPIVPSAILCIGLNYRKHAEESGVAVPRFPVLFMKGGNTLQNPEDPIVLPRRLLSTKVDYECELAVVIGRRCKNVSREDALKYVLGYTCANDVSARDWQIEFGGTQWCRGKGFDTFMPLGPCLVTGEDIPNPAGLKIRTILNGEIVQDWNTSDLIFDVPELISFLSGSSTLEAGTVILTGTPHGVGMARKPPVWLQPGDRVNIEIDQVGTLTNPVVEET